VQIDCSCFLGLIIPGASLVLPFNGRCAAWLLLVFAMARFILLLTLTATLRQVVGSQLIYRTKRIAANESIPVTGGLVAKDLFGRDTCQGTDPCGTRVLLYTHDFCLYIL
jgi:hypothetical protein